MDRSQGDAIARIFCFPYAGGGASIFRDWRKQAPEDIDIAAIQLPGREDRFCERRLNCLSEVIDQLREVIVEFIDRPYMFFGHSLGALIAFELARNLGGQGLRRPFHIVVSGKRAPHLPSDEERMHELGDREFLDKIREFNGTPSVLIDNPELMELFIPIMRDDFAIAETYIHRPGRILDCDLTALCGDEDFDVPVDTVRAWDLHTAGKFSYKVMHGDHFFLHKNQEDILKLLVGIARSSGNK
jgi:medium-chain acyl-[acyl-carrier-protein] hydrolase